MRENDEQLSDGGAAATPRPQQATPRPEQASVSRRGRGGAGRTRRNEVGNVSVPVYLHVAKVLAERVTAGTYAPGTALPSGAELCEEFGVSPMTLRRALARLQSQGMITAVRGKGTFVRSPSLGDSLFRLDPVAGDWIDERAEIRLLSAAMTRADEKVAAVLRLAPGDRVIYLRRLVLNEGAPVMYHLEYIVYDPRRPLVEAQLKLTSMSALLDPGRARSFPRGELTLTAAALGGEDARALARPEGALAFRLEHVFREADGTPVSWGWFLLPAELFRLRAWLGPEWSSLESGNDGQT